jgi:hypothetical protein
MPAIDWNHDRITRVIEAIADGVTLRAVAKNEGISASAIIRFVQNDESFAKQYAHAKEIQLEAFADEIMQIADSADEKTVNAARLQVDSRKWLLSKLVPKKYGDKLDLNHSGEVAVKRVIVR